MLGFVALLGAGVLIANFASPTGNYASAGGGKWYYGPHQAQLQPDEACIYAGYEPQHPWTVYKNEWGTVLSQCKKGTELIGVPVIQTIYVKP